MNQENMLITPVRETRNLIYHIEWLVLLLTMIGCCSGIMGMIYSSNARVDQVMLLMHNETVAFHKETKEFHGRLSILEEKIK